MGGFCFRSLRGPSALSMLWLLLPSLPPRSFSFWQSSSQQPRKSHRHPTKSSGAHSPPALASPASHRIYSCLGCSLRTRKRRNSDNGGGCLGLTPAFALCFLKPKCFHSIHPHHCPMRRVVLDSTSPFHRWGNRGSEGMQLAQGFRDGNRA